MKLKRLIRYRIPVSVKFPATQPKKGDHTFFVEGIKIALAKNCLDPETIDIKVKRHTIRGNYTQWAKRFEKINRGEAVLELYYWSGKPYNSKAVTICQLGKDDGIGLQKLSFHDSENWGMGQPIIPSISHHEIHEIANNDGLSFDDFNAWFKGCDLSQPFAIIHFTPFRY